MQDLLALFALFFLAWLWLDSLRAREKALSRCVAACDQRGVQLLDQTVALRRLGLSWTAAGLKIRRVYRFDYSDEGVGRHFGQIVLIGQDLVDVGFGFTTSPTTAQASEKRQ